MTKEDIPPYMTIAQAVTFSHFSEPTIRKAISEGKLRATKPLARDARIERGDFKNWMATGDSAIPQAGLEGPGGINFMDIRKLEYLRSIAPEVVARFEEEQGRSFLENLAKLFERFMAENKPLLDKVDATMRELAKTTTDAEFRARWSAQDSKETP